MRRLRSFVAALLIPAAALAQVDRATLSGVVHDASGAVVPAATVTVTHVATNISNTATRATITSLAGDPRIMQFSLRVDL